MNNCLYSSIGVCEYIPFQEFGERISSLKCGLQGLMSRLINSPVTQWGWWLKALFCILILFLLLVHYCNNEPKINIKDWLALMKTPFQSKVFKLINVFNKTFRAEFKIMKLNCNFCASLLGNKLQWNSWKQFLSKRIIVHVF